MSLQAATLPLLLPCHPAKGMLLLPYAGYTSVKRGFALLAAISSTSGSLVEPATMVVNVFSRLMDYIPPPPVREDGALAEVPNMEST